MSPAFTSRYRRNAPATWNRELAILRSASRLWIDKGWLAEVLAGGLARRRERPDRTRALTRAQIESVWRRSDIALREKTLWRLLYETAARTDEILALDVPDLDLANKRARIRSRRSYRLGVLVDRLRPAATALISGRETGPVFLGERRPTRPVASLDVDRDSGRARLSNHRAAHLFNEETGWTLQQLRHSALTHAAEDGTNLPMLLARSRHASVRSLERYARPGPEAVARHVAEQDPARRRR